MDYRALFQISATGMSVEKLRLEVTTSNIANMHSTAATPEQRYQPLRVLSQATPFAFSQQFDALYSVPQAGTQIVGVEPQAVAPRLVYEPNHPHADSKGFVSYPGVNHTAEMVNLMSALRSYEANVIAMNAAKTMASRALDIGGQG